MAKEKVTVLLGKFESEADLQNYVRFTYDENGVPSSELCRQMGIEWFDEDFIEAFMFNQEQPFEGIMQASYADTFNPSLQKKLSSVQLNSYNSVIFLYRYNHIIPLRDEGKVFFAGAFDYTTD